MIAREKLSECKKKREIENGKNSKITENDNEKGDEISDIDNEKGDEISENENEKSNETKEKEKDDERNGHEEGSIGRDIENTIPCEDCKEHEIHLEKAAESRRTYRLDVENNNDPSDPIFSMDMQKVLMLPHLPGMKTALFTRRIIMINQSIVLVGEFSEIPDQEKKAKGYIWHEAIQGRKDEDVSSVIIKFINESSCRDVDHVTIWCDNCSGQNKNWTLHSSLVYCMFSNSNKLKTITLKYFEKGHTIMSCNSFHHLIEDNIQHEKYDFNDYVQCVEKAGSAIKMKPSDCLDLKNKKGVGKDTRYPLLCTISVVQFRRKSTKLYWKTSFTDTVFKSGQFLQKKQEAMFSTRERRS